MEDKREENISEEANVESDILNDFFGEETPEPIEMSEETITHEQTTMFFNKYCEDTNIPSVANKLASTIVNYEIDRGVTIENDDDFEMDDERVTEDQFLQEQEESDSISEIHIDKELGNSSANQKEEVNELRNHLDLLSNSTEEETKILATHALKKVEQIKKKYGSYLCCSW